MNTCDPIEGADVESYDAEDEVIMAWKDLVKRLDPDIITGYNIFGFDMKYVWERAEELGIDEHLCVGLGRINNRRTILDKKELSSAALGNNIMYFFDLDGVISIDMYKVMQRDHKLDSYKLDSVASVFLGDKKDDISPAQIFSKFYGSSTDRCEVARYCIQDCALVNRLLSKLKVLENNVGMGNVCSVPLSYLFMRGQGIKIFSLVSKESRSNDTLIPVIRNSFSDNEKIDVNADEGYEGAIVLDPQEGMYLEDPIVVLDYNSLYPSSMISRNLSHDSYVADPESKYAKMQDKGIKYETVVYDVYEGKGDAKKVVGKRECIFAQFPDGKKGIIPMILQNLLNQRKNTRKRMEYETLTLSDGRIAVGLVSDLGNGQLEILNVDKANIGEGFGGHKATIDASLVINRSETYDKFEQAVLDALQLAYKVTANSLYGQTGSRTSPIYLKEIAACTTATGREMIYLAKNFVEEKYGANVIYGDSVMPYTPITYIQDGLLHVKTISELYLQMDKTWLPYPQFKPNSEDLSDKEQFYPDDMKVWTHKGLAIVKRVIRHKTIKKIYRVCTPTGIIDVTEDHSLLKEDATEIKPEELEVGTNILHSQPVFNTPKHASFKIKQIARNEFDLITECVPESILNSIQDIMISFIKTNNIQYYIRTNSHDIAQSYILLFQQLGYTTFVQYTECINVYYCSPENKNMYIPENKNMVNKLFILYEQYNGYVYDIETEFGVFHAGIGNMIVKNTDSIFIKFTHKDSNGNPVKGKEALPLAIAAGQRVEKEIKAIMPNSQNLAYEKTLWPFIILSKKRYVGNLYEDNINKYKQKSMGIVLKRRDNAPIVKTVYGGIIDTLLNKGDFLGSVTFLQNKLQEIVSGKISLEELIISKTLRASYKDPSKIAHKVLAKRMGERDAGNKPQANDRIPFVFINVPEGTEVKLQGDRIEHPDYIRDECLTPDYYHYITNQLIKPICQIYALCVDKLPGYTYPPSHWEQMDIEMSDQKMYTDEKKRRKRIQALKQKEVVELLFAKYLDILKPNRNVRAHKKRHVLDLDKNITTQDNKELFIFTIICEKYKNTDTNTKIKGAAWQMTLTILNASQNIEVFNEVLIIKNKKHMAYVRAVEHGFKKIYELFQNIVNDGKLCVKTDSAFITKWKSAYKNIHTLQEKLQKIMNDCDAGQLDELQETESIVNLIGFRDTLPYTLECL